MNLSGSDFPSNDRPCFLPLGNSSKKQKLEIPGDITAIQRYTDADLAAEMNALTFEERHRIEQDIHGVADIIEETDEFVDEKILEMKESLSMIPDIKKTAWDRAVFLRPSLASDRPLHLMLLRAMRFNPRRAAAALVYQFEAKQNLFGDDLLIHRITWQDLTPEDQAMYRSGYQLLIPRRDRTGRGIMYSRLHLWDVSDPKVFLRATYYVAAAIEDEPAVQRKGVVSVADFRGSWKSSFLQVIKLVGDEKAVLDKLPYHKATGHLVYDDPNVDTFIQGIRAVLGKEHRTRHRFHCGSDIEIDYSLRSFGIDLSDYLALDSSKGPTSMMGIEEDIRQREKIDEEWRRSEAPYRDPLSRKALFPNPQDIIMGRNRKIASAWPGNMVYSRLIEQHAQLYIAVEDQDRIAKTSIAIQIHGILRTDYRARFLTRGDSTWEMTDDVDVQRKISQALRNAAREMRPNPFP